MDRKFPITKDRLRNAWTYSRWVIVLLIALSLGGCNLFYEMTAYRVPEDKKVEFFLDLYGSADAALDGLMESIHREALPELEQVSYRFMNLDETYGSMQLTTWISAGEGNVFWLTEDTFRMLAESGALQPLQPLIDEGRIDVGEADLAAGYAVDQDSGTRMLFGVPTAVLPGLEGYGIYGTGYVAILVQQGAELDHSVTFFNYLTTHLREPIAAPAASEAAPAPTVAPAA